MAFLVSINLQDLNLAAAERTLIVTALHATSGSIVEAAALLGITRHALRRRIVKHQIELRRAGRRDDVGGAA